jgi:hypothetical protein
MTIPEGTDQTVDNKTLSITNARAVQIPYTGEDVLHLNNGIGFETVYGDQIAQAMRVLTNEMEADLAEEAYKNASRAFGTAGTTPFGSSFSEIAELRQILVDNGMPADNQVSLILNTLAGTNLRQLAQLQKANEAGGTDLLRQGTLLDLQGIMIKESAQVKSHTKGTGTGYKVNKTGGLVIGDTTIPVDTGSGTIVAGDIISFNADTVNKYVVGTAFSGGEFAINPTGIRSAIADTGALSVGDSYTANVAFHRRALELAVRAPAVPQGGDIADDAMTVQDPVSGLVFEVRVYKGYRKTMIEVAASWGVKAWKSDFIAVLAG